MQTTFKILIFIRSGAYSKITFYLIPGSVTNSGYKLLKDYCTVRFKLKKSTDEMVKPSLVKEPLIGAFLS